MLLFVNIVGETENKRTTQVKIDENLFKRIGNNDMKAFEELYNQTERILYAYVFSIVKNHDDTVDIVHDAYIKIISAAHLYKPMGKPLAWMFTISFNIARTKLSKSKRYRETEKEDYENNLLFSYEMDADDRMVLQKVLKVLNEEERQIVLLHSVTGMKHREIAYNLNMPLSTVLSKYNRSLKKLKSALEKEVSSDE